MGKPPRFLVDETTLVFAFRYALGRGSAAPSHMVTQLRKRWSRLAGWTQKQIQDEIRFAIDLGDAGDRCDIDTWSAILEWEVKSDEPNN